MARLTFLKCSLNLKTKNSVVYANILNGKKTILVIYVIIFVMSGVAYGCWLQYF